MDYEQKFKEMALMGLATAVLALIMAAFYRMTC